MPARLIDKLKTLWLQHMQQGPTTAYDDATERTLIENIEDLGELTAEDVMVPRADIVAIDVNAGTDAFLSLIKATPHSRIPVYQNALDDILGFVHIKDVLKTMAQGGAIHLRDLLRDAMIVSPSLPALDLLVDMRKGHKALALVIDEYGGIDGLVTMGDLIEAIVGEINDEHVPYKQPRLIEKPDGSVTADARFPISEFEKKFGDIFSDTERNEADTLGGLAMFLATRLPVRGEIVTHSSGLQIEVLDADARRVKRLRLRNIPKPEAEQAEAAA